MLYRLVVVDVLLRRYGNDRNILRQALLPKEHRDCHDTGEREGRRGEGTDTMSGVGVRFLRGSSRSFLSMAIWPVCSPTAAGEEGGRKERIREREKREEGREH